MLPELALLRAVNSLIIGRLIRGSADCGALCCCWRRLFAEGSVVSGCQAAKVWRPAKMAAGTPPWLKGARPEHALLLGPLPSGCVQLQPGQCGSLILSPAARLRPGEALDLGFCCCCCCLLLLLLEVIGCVQLQPPLLGCSVPHTGVGPQRLIGRSGPGRAKDIGMATPSDGKRCYSFAVERLRSVAAQGEETSSSPAARTCQARGRPPRGILQ